MTDEQVKTLGGYILAAAVIVAIALSPPLSETVSTISYLLLAIVLVALLLFFLWQMLLKIAYWMEPIMAAIDAVEDRIGNKLRQFRVPMLMRMTIRTIYAVLIFGSVLYWFAAKGIP